jgi:nicotinamide-nucleotide amidase
MTNNNIEILSVGNELLIGKITNTNAQWLAKRITTTGLSVTRITVIGDDVNEISKIVREVIIRKPKMLITTGGLGPTFDDKTLEGIAKAFDQPLKASREAVKMIEETYERFFKEGRIDEKIELTPPRMKMATMPEKAQPLNNPVGTAPGVMLKAGITTIVALPGVPIEMEAIFDESIQPLLKKMAGGVTFYETSITVSGIMESDIAPLIDRAMSDNPYVYIKSHPSRSGEGKPFIELHLSTTASDPEIGKKKVEQALVQIMELAQGKGGMVKPKKSDRS